MDHLKCTNCGAELSVEPHLRTALCPYCASPSVIDRPPAAGRPDPTFAVGFALDRDAARERVRAWLSGRTLFAKSGFKRAALEDIRGVYLPAYLYSAVARSSFRARIGENYTETESYTTVENGKTVRKTRTVTKTEWYPLSGRHTDYVADVVVSASRGLPNEELEKVEPFDLRGLRRFAPALVSGWIAEEASTEPQHCLAAARNEARERADRRVERFLPGDTQSDVQVSTEVGDEALEPCLVPIWVMAARYHKKAPPVRVLVNGQSGKVWGQTPLSWIKIASAVAAVLALAAGIALLATQL